MTIPERNRWFICVIALLLQGAIRVAPVIVPGVVPSFVDHKLDIVIAQESGQQNDKIGALFVALRGSAFSDYCKSKGHTLDILDKDVTDENGKKIVADADIAGKTLPVVLCYDKASHKLLAAVPITAGASVDTVMQVVKGAGG